MFAAGAAVAPVTRWELYDTALYRALSWATPDRSRALPAPDALDYAVKIADPLLLVHGMADDNVVFQN